MEYGRSTEALEGSGTIPDVVGSMSQLQRTCMWQLLLRNHQQQQLEGLCC